MQPALVGGLVLRDSYVRFFRCDQAHAFEFWQDNFALENPFSVYCDLPFSLWLAAVGCVFRVHIRDLQSGFDLVEVPVQSCPQHHGDLSGRRAGGLEIIAAGVRYRGDVEVVVIECRSFVSMYCLLSGDPVFFGGSLVLLRNILKFRVAFILGIDHNCPARWKRGVGIRGNVRFEKEAAEDRGDCEVLAVGEMDHSRRHDDDGGVGMYEGSIIVGVGGGRFALRKQIL